MAQDGLFSRMLGSLLGSDAAAGVPTNPGATPPSTVPSQAEIALLGKDGAGAVIPQNRGDLRLPEAGVAPDPGREPAFEPYRVAQAQGVTPPPRIRRFVLDPSKKAFLLPAETPLDDLVVSGRNIVVRQPDGSQIVLEDAVTQVGDTYSVQPIIVGSTEIPATTLAAALGVSQVQIAAGGEGGSIAGSGGNLQFPEGGIGDPLPISPLLGPTELGSAPPEIVEILPVAPRLAAAAPVNGTPTIRGMTPSAVDEEGLEGGNAGDSYAGGDQTGEAITATGQFDIDFGTDGPHDVEAVVLSATGATWAQATTTTGTLTAGDGTWKLTVNADGTYTFTVLAASHHSEIDLEDDLTIFVTLTVKDGNGDVVSGSFDITINDDGPLLSAAINVIEDGEFFEEGEQFIISPSVVVDETIGDKTGDDNSDDEVGQPDPFTFTTPRVLIGLASIDGGALLDVDARPGADAAGTSPSYSLQIGTAGANSGLKTTDGTEILLCDEDGIVVGRAGADESPVAFAIGIDPETGDLTVAQYLALNHPDGTDHDDIVYLGTGLVSVVVTLTDGDGDTVRAPVDLGGQVIGFEDDGPTITLATSELPLLVTDDSEIPDVVESVSFAGLFTSAFGADGAKDTDHDANADADAITYALGVSTDGADSGLVDTLTGDKILLRVDSDGNVEGYLENDDTEIAFEISVDPETADVTLSQSRAVVHNDPADPVESGASAAILASTANLITLTATITDGDGDTATAVAEIGAAFRFQDDGPTATIEASQLLAEGTTLSGTFDFVAGADEAGITHIGATSLSFGDDDWSQWVDLGSGEIRAKADGTYEFKADAVTLSPVSPVTGTFTVTDGDGDTVTRGFEFSIADANKPSAGTAAAAVDDDGLSGGNVASTTNDLDANSGGDTNSSEAVFSGTLGGSVGLDGAGANGFTFAPALHGATATIGLETVTYSLSGSTLMATGPRGVLFTVAITDQATGAYTVTLLDNVLHAGGPNDENPIDPTAAIAYVITDADGSSVTTNTLTITFDDDAPRAYNNTTSLDETYLQPGAFTIIERFNSSGGVTFLGEGEVDDGHAELSTGGSSRPDEGIGSLEAGWGILANSIDNLVGNAIEGSGLAKVFTTTTTDNLVSFEYKFEQDNQGPDDTAFYFIKNSAGAIVASGIIATGADATGTRLVQFSGPVGTYTLLIGVVDEIDDDDSSSLEIDNIALAPATLVTGSVSGNVVTDANVALQVDSAGADGLGGVTQIQYYNESNVLTPATVTAGGITVDTRHGSLFINSTGAYTFTADLDAAPTGGSVTESITYTIKDGDGDIATSTLTVTVNDVQAPPNLPSTLNGSITTNTSSADQVMLVTFADTHDYRDAFSTVVLRDSQGGQGALVEDAGFNINSAHQFIVSVENSLPISKVIITDFNLEGVTMLPPGGGGGGGNNIQLDYHSGSGADYALVSTILSSAPGSVIGAYSTDGGTGGDGLTDSGTGSVTYLYGNAGADTLTGSADRDLLHGGSGADQLLGNGGNDILVFDENDTSINGGDGNDILRIDDGAHFNTVGVASGFSNKIVDLIDDNIVNIEAILLSSEGIADPGGTIGTTLRIGRADVVEMSTTDALYIIGSEGDVVDLLGSSDAATWSQGAIVTSSSGQTFRTYTSDIGSGPVATLFIDRDITVTGTN
jgi:VCBS repeat-containing protein